MSDDIRSQWLIVNAASTEGRDMIARDSPFGAAVFGAPVAWNVIPLLIGNPLAEDDE